MPLEAEPGVEATAAGDAAPTDSPVVPPSSDPGRVDPTAGAVATDDPGDDPPAGPDPDQGPSGNPAEVPGGSIADIGEADQALDSASVTAARLAGVIGVAAGSVSGLAAVLVAAVATPLGGLAAAGLGALVLALSAAGAAACYLWPAVRYRHTRYRLDAHGVTIRRGVVWRTVTSVPTSRVQHTDVLRGPVERYFDLATLVIHTAGTRDASVALGGLRHRAALALRDRLIEAGGGGGG